MPKILSGPYGSLIHDKLTKEGASERERGIMTHPAAILDKERPRNMIKAIARLYREKGADVLTTNTFPSRLVLQGDQKDLYPYVLRQHLQVVQEVAHDQNQIAVSFGPFGDCYKPDEGPSTVEDGQAFWEEAFEPLLSSSGKLDYALAETVNNGIEAIAIAKAWQKIRRFTRGRIEGVLSFIPEKNGVRLLNGERIADVIKAIHTELGTLPILLGLNCCSIDALEPTITDVLNDRDASRTGAQFRFLYPNASDLDPLSLEQSPVNKSSHTDLEVAQKLVEVVKKYERHLPGAANHIIINQCCGGTPAGTQTIAQHLRTQFRTVPVA